MPVKTYLKSIGAMGDDNKPILDPHSQQKKDTRDQALAARRALSFLSSTM